MPFNYRRDIAYQPISPNIIAGASKSPFSIAGEEMTKLSNAIDNRVFNRDVQKVSSLEDLLTMKVPQTPEAMAQFKQKQGLLGAIEKQKQQQPIFDLNVAKAQAYNEALNRYNLGLDIDQQAQQTDARLPQIGGGAFSALTTPTTPLYDPTIRQEDLKTLGKYVAPTATGSTRRDAYQQAVDNFMAAYPNPTQEQWTQFNRDYNKKTLAGVRGAGEDIEERELAADYNKVLDYKDKFASNPNKAKSFDLGGMRALETRTLNNKPTEERALIKDTVKSMKANQVFVSGVNKLLSDYSNDKLPTKVDKDMVANTVQKLRTVFGSDADQMYTNIDFNSRSGRLLGAYMKATSGLAVSDNERAFLTDLFTGGWTDDENAIIARMQSFNKSMMDENNILAGQIFDSAPYSATKFRRYEEYKGYEPSKEEPRQEFKFEVGGSSPFGKITEVEGEYYRTEDGIVHKRGE